MAKKRQGRPAQMVSPLFDTVADQEGTNGQRALIEAEHLLLDLADYVYAHTALKPISKTLFLISRCLCVAKLGAGAATAAELSSQYQHLRTVLDGSAPSDDFDFATVVAECEHHIPYVLDAINQVCRLTAKTDSLGQVFNTLLRGKFEGGEGLGTFLTPEEVVFPMVDVLLKALDPKALERLGGPSPLLYGDICGGTGRFVYALARRLGQRGVPAYALESAARLFDQSLLAVDLGKLNFLFEGMKPACARVGDSLNAAQVSALRSRFLLLATNPPFGAGKYRWNKELALSLPYEVLAALGMRNPGDTTDPSALFFFRNLDLLAPGGALAIVLPDGVVQSEAFRKALTVYEQVRKAPLHVAAVVSLPPVPRPGSGAAGRLLAHAGLARRRSIAARPGQRLVVRQAARARRAGKQGPRLHEGGRRRGRGAVPRVGAGRGFDGPDRHYRRPQEPTPVEGTGLPAGDVLVSCMNPKIWRVAVIPRMPGVWSCSPEFVVLRPNPSEDPWRIALALHHPTVMQAVQAMAQGTSSSRQRVPKECVLAVNRPEIEGTKQLADYVAWREEFYAKRLSEGRAYEDIHQGGSKFAR